MQIHVYVKYGEREREINYLSVSGGAIKIRSFGLNLSALSMNLFASLAFLPKGGFSPMIYSGQKDNNSFR